MFWDNPYNQTLVDEHCRLAWGLTSSRRWIAAEYGARYFLHPLSLCLSFVLAFVLPRPDAATRLIPGNSRLATPTSSFRRGALMAGRVLAWPPITPKMTSPRSSSRQGGTISTSCSPTRTTRRQFAPRDSWNWSTSSAGSRATGMTAGLRGHGVTCCERCGSCAAFS